MPDGATDARPPASKRPPPDDGPLRFVGIDRALDPVGLFHDLEPPDQRKAQGMGSTDSIDDHHGLIVPQLVADPVRAIE